MKNIIVFHVIIIISAILISINHMGYPSKNPDCNEVYNDREIFENDFIPPPPRKWTIPKYLEHYKGDPRMGKMIFNKARMYRKPKYLPAGNCAACHSGKGIRGGGDIGPAFSAGLINSWKVRGGDAFLYQQIADARYHNPETVMPPLMGMKLPKKYRLKWKPIHILDLIAYLKTLK